MNKKQRSRVNSGKRKQIDPLEQRGGIVSSGVVDYGCDRVPESRG
jgi:hypothetical protein